MKSDRQQKWMQHDTCFFKSILDYHLELVRRYPYAQNVSSTMENDLVEMMMQIWQMHVGLYTLQSLFDKMHASFTRSYFFGGGQQIGVIALLDELKLVVENGSFLQPLNERIYTNLLKQIRQFYTSEQVIFIKSSHCKPWYSNDYKSLHVMI